MRNISINDLPILISTLSERHIELLLKRTSLGLYTNKVPHLCQTIHSFIPFGLFDYKTNNWNPTKFYKCFLFQNFYFAYPSHINQQLSKPIFMDTKIELKLNSLDDVYIIDSTNANIYRNNILNRTNTHHLTDEKYLKIYYQHLLKKFNKLENISFYKYLKEYKNPIFLIQRGIDFNNEIVKILNTDYQTKYDNLKQNLKPLGNEIDLYVPSKKKKTKKGCVIS